METNQLQITTMLQFHITFTLASITLCSRAVAVVSQQWPVTLLLPSDFIDFMIFFFAEILLTGDPKVTNARTHERVRGTLQQSLYRQGKRGLRLRDGVSSLDFVEGIFYDLHSF